MSNLSEEEKEAIEQLKSWREYMIKNKEKVNRFNDIEFYLRTVQNLIEKQQKELEQEKEKNKQILGDNIENFRKLFAEEFSKQFITKDKIRELVKEIKDRPVEDMFISASKAKLDTIIDIEKLLGE